MWFNLERLKNLERKFITFEKTRASLFHNLFESNWSRKREAADIIIEYGHVSKMKFFFLDVKRHFIFLKHKKKFIKADMDFTDKSFFLIDNLYILNYNINTFSNEKKNILLAYENIVKEKNKYAIKKNVIVNKQFLGLNKLILLFKYFLLNEKILLYFNFFQFLYESFFFNFIILEKFLKIFFLKSFRVAEKLKVWDDCQWITSGSSVFFIEGSYWVKNKEIFDEKNKEFFDFVPIDILYYTWIYEFYDEDDSLQRQKKFLYFKYLELESLLHFNLYRYKNLKKNIVVFQFFLRFLDKNSLNYAEFLHLILPDLINRIKLKQLIFKFTIKLQELFKKKNKKKVSIELLSPKQDKIIDFLFYFIFLNYIQIRYDINIQYLNLLRKKIKKKLKKKSSNFKRLKNFKRLFIIFFKFQNNKLFNFNKTIFIFFMCFYFLIIESNIKNLSNFYLIKKKYYKNFFLEEFTVSYFFNFSQTMSKIFEYQTFVVHPLKYDFLYKTLFYHYKHYWEIFYKEIFFDYHYSCDLLIAKMKKFNFFVKHKKTLRLLYELYVLTSHNYWNLYQYHIFIKKKLQIFRLFFNTTYGVQEDLKKKNFKKIYYKNLSKRSKKKIYFKSLKYSYLFFLYNKFNLYNINWNVMYTIYNLLDLKKFKKLYNSYIFLKQFNINVPLTLIKDFRIITAFFTYLEKRRVKVSDFRFEKLMNCLYFIYLIRFFFFYHNKSTFLRKLRKIKLNFLLFINKIKLNNYIGKKKKDLKIFKNNNWMVLRKIKNLKFFRKKNIKFLWHFRNIIQFENIINYKNSKVLKNLYLLNAKDIFYNQFVLFLKLFFMKRIINIYNEILLRLDYNKNLGLEFFVYNDTKNRLNLFKNKKKINLEHVSYISFNLDICWLKIKNKIYNNMFFINLNKKNLLLFFFNYSNKIYFSNMYKDLDETIFLMDYRFYTNITLLKSKIGFFITIFLFFFDKLIEENKNILDNINTNLMFLNRYEKNCKIKLKVIDKLIKNYIYIYKKIYFKYPKRFKPLNFIYNKNLYINFYLLKKKLILKLKKINKFFFKGSTCFQCNLIIVNEDYKKKIQMYQKYLNLDQINSNFIKFEFTFCKKCKLSVLCIEKQKIYSFFTRKQFLLYLINKEGYFGFSVLNGRFFNYMLLPSNDVIVKYVEGIQIYTNKFIINHAYIISSLSNLNVWDYLEDNFIWNFQMVYVLLFEVHFFYVANQIYQLPTFLTRLNHLKVILDMRARKHKHVKNLELNEKKLKYKITREMHRVIKRELLMTFFKKFIKSKF